MTVVALIIAVPASDSVHRADGHCGRDVRPGGGRVLANADPQEFLRSAD